MKVIEILYKKIRKKVLVDDKDFLFLSKIKWRLNRCLKNDSFYVIGTISRKAVLMHRFILKPPSNRVVDHKNGNPLDNRRENLRICTQSENMRARRASRKLKHGFRGITKRMIGGKETWFASLSLGHFPTPEDAAKAYDKWAKEIFGEFAHLNFPEK